MTLKVLRSSYSEKKISRSKQIANSLTIELLTLPGLDKAKKRLSDDPDKMNALAAQGILRDTIRRLPIGLSNDNRLYMPLYNQFMTVGGIFYFDEKFEIGTYEFTMNSPHYVVGNPAASWDKKSRDEITICYSIKDVILAFQIGIDFPVMVPDVEYFPHKVFMPYKRITTLQSNSKILDLLGRDYVASYQLERELEPEDKLENLEKNKRWFAIGTEQAIINTNPFTYLDNLWWHIITPNSRKHYLLSSNGENYDLEKKVYRKEMYYVANTEYGDIHLNGDVAISSLPEDPDSPPTTKEMMDEVYLTLMSQLPFLREDYARALTYWIMYAYVHPVFPFAPQGLMVCLDNNAYKQALYHVMVRYLMPAAKEGYKTLTTPSANILYVERDNLPIER